MGVHPGTGDKMELQVVERATVTSAGYIQGSSKPQLESRLWQLSSAQPHKGGQGERAIPSCPALASDLE